MRKRLNESQKNGSKKNQKTRLRAGRQKWEKPTLEDVSGKIMAQPYIRFT